MVTKQKPEKEVAVPRYYEMEVFRRSINRRMWITMLALFTVALLSLGIALIAFARPVPVVVFDGDGQPVYFEDTRTPRQELTDVRISYMAKEFLSRFIGIDSVQVEDDFARALAMMTPRLRQIVASDKEELERRAAYRGQNVRSVFRDWKVRIGKYDPKDLEGRVFVIVTGRMVFEPRFGELEGEGAVSRYFIAQLAFQRVPVTDLSIHGMLVDFVNTRLFEDEAELKKYMLEKAGRP
jgi:hypothetical protein